MAEVSTPPLLPLRRDIVFPGMWAPLVVATKSSVMAVEAAAATEDKVIAVGFQRDPDGDAETPARSDLLDFGVLCVLRRMERKDDVVHLILQVLQRISLGAVTQPAPYLRCEVREDAVVPGEGAEIEGRHRAVLDAARALDAHRDPRQVPLFAPLIEQISSPIHQLYLIATLLDLDRARREAVLAASTHAALLELISDALRHEAQIAKVRRDVAAQTGAEMDRQMRERLLRQQLETIRRELGETGGEEAEIGELRKQLEAAELPENVRAEAQRSLVRLERTSPMSPEFQTVRSHLELILELPWTRLSPDRLDLVHARAVLDEDHFGLDDVKDRIIEHLAVMKLNPESRAPILCLVGPPGVGKTSLGASIARALGRTLERLSLGGLHDEAELRGHRRTYVGAMPGRIVQAIRRAGVRNPILMLDEIDKIGQDFRGDPAAALLEILDPEQNVDFHDNYLDLSFDLSSVFFITTANSLDPIPRPLLDRMEVLQLSGYTAEEKREIARRYLVPRQRRRAGLTESQLELPDATLDVVIRRYTREAGVRDLERRLAQIARRIAVRVVRGEPVSPRVEPGDLLDLLGPERAADERARAELPPGSVAGLAWTEAGGDVLYVEAVRLPPGRELTLTGQLGKVMQESARAAQSYVFSRARELGIDPAEIERASVHIHVPAGAIPKDGPSAGVTMAAALASLFSGRRARTDTAMTGEITLTGLVLPVGGIREKVLAAHRAGLRRVVLPRANEVDLAKLPPHLRAELEVILADTIEDVLAAVLEPAAPATACSE